MMKSDGRCPPKSPAHRPPRRPPYVAVPARGPARVNAAIVRHIRWLSVVGALAIATAIVYALEDGLALQNASSVYLVAVAGVAIRMGTVPAVVSAVAAFITYNLLVIEPRFTLAVARLDELLALFLLLFVGTVIGRLAGHQRDRELFAKRREREARALFAITRELATAERLPDAMQAIVERINLDARMRRTWIGLGPTHAQQRIAADTAADARLPLQGAHAVLSATGRRTRRPGRGSDPNTDPPGGGGARKAGDADCSSTVWAR